MCQRNLTRRSIPATEKAIKKMLVGAGANTGNHTGNPINVNLTDMSELSNGTLTMTECFQLGGAEVTYDIPYVSAMWMGLAIPFGLLIGAILALLTFRFCCKRYWKQDCEECEEHVESTERNKTWKKYLMKIFPFFFSSSARNPKISLSNMRSNKPAKSTQFGYERLENQTDSSSEHAIIEPPAETVMDLENGIADALLANSSEEVEGELLRQDIEALNEVEQSLVNNRNMLSEGIAHVHLNQMSEGTKADQAVIGKVMKQLREKLIASEQDIEKQYKRKVRALNCKTDMASDPGTMEKELNRLNAEIRQKRHGLFKSCIADFRNSLKAETKLNDAQLADFSSELSKNLAKLEQILNENLDARAQVLMERSVYRAHLADQMKTSEDDLELQLENHEASMHKSLRNLATDQRISKQCVNSVMASFSDALHKLKKSHKKDIKKQMQESAGRLKKYRSEGLTKLKKKHKEQLRSLKEKTETSENAEEFLTMTKSVLEKQNDELADFWSETDKDEASKLKNNHLKLENSFQEDLGRAVDEGLDTLRLESTLTQTEIKSLKRELELEVAELERIREMDRKVKQKELRDQLELKRKNMDRKLVRTDTELQKIAERQENILLKALDFQTDIDDKDREQILAEYEHTKNQLNSLMKIERIKQEKLLDAKLCQRKASIAKANSHPATLKQNTNNDENNVEDSENDKAQMEIEKENLLLALREKIAEETQLLLEKQDESMADIIGLLQVGQARRQTFLDRQNKLHQRLEHVRQLELELQKEAKEVESVDGGKLDELITEYKSNLEQLNVKLQSSRKKQLEHLKEKLENKRKLQERTVQSRFDDREKDAILDSRRNNISFAGGRMIANSVRKRRQEALERLDSQARIQLQKERQKLSREMQDDLDKCLLEQKQSFLSQIGSLIHLNPVELNNLVRSSQLSLGTDKKSENGSENSSFPVPSVNSLDGESGTVSFSQSGAGSGLPRAHPQPEIFNSLSGDISMDTPPSSMAEPPPAPKRRQRHKKRKFAAEQSAQKINPDPD